MARGGAGRYGALAGALVLMWAGASRAQTFPSNGAWLRGLLELAGHPRLGTLPDFGNFLVSNNPPQWYDRYRGVEELMPFAKGVSAKSFDFDAAGNETQTDFLRMMKIVIKHGYRGYVGVEYEGNTLSEPDGIRATRDLLMRIRDQLD